MLTCVRPSGYKNKAFMNRGKTLRRLLYQTYCLFGFIFARGWVCSICLCVQMYTQEEVRGQHQVSYSNHLPFEEGSLPGPSPH